LSDSARLVGAAAAVLISVVAVNLIKTLPQRGSHRPGPTPAPRAPATPTPPPTPTPTPTPPPQPPPSAAFIAPGTYHLTDDFPIPVSVEVPARWSACSLGPLEQRVCSANGLGGASFMVIDNVVADPCSDVGLE